MAYASYGTLSGMFPEARIELKFGIERRGYTLHAVPAEGDGISYENDIVRLEGERRELEGGFRYDLRLTNLSKKSIRVTRLHFPAEGGLGAFLGDFDPRKVAFLRNGYQSWSTARSYKLSDKPLRPRLRMVSLASSNMANLPSNTPGMLSSEMYSVITDLSDGRSMLIGQEPPFDQFFYIVLNVDKRRGRSFFELIFDFGRQMVEGGRTIKLDGFILIAGTRSEVEQSYFHGIREGIGYKPPERNLKGWCSWYQYYQKITPEILYANIKAIKECGTPFDFFQIDDGWQANVGDWLEEAPAFRGRMRELADAVRQAGMRPGLWFAPFAASATSELARLHPEYLLKNEYGKIITAGYNPIWKGYYYGLDATHPRFAEYLKETVRKVVGEWGFEYLKCDFLFAACLRGAAHHELEISRSMVLKEGMRLIRGEAGPSTVIIGCGMPLSAGIGYVDAMRVGPDTGDFWLQWAAKILRTGAMVGARNSIRNFMVRSPMHKRLWLNDPDCVMIRDTDTGLKPAERQAQMDAIALSGGILMFSDDFSTLSKRALADLSLIDSIAEDCFAGQAIAIDVMEKEMPEVYYNTAGYVGFFNFYGPSRRRFDLSALRRYESGLERLVDMRTGKVVPAGSEIVLEGMPKRGSRLFRIEPSKRREEL